MKIRGSFLQSRPKAKLSACQGWEALYPVAGEYAVSCEPSLLHLERIGDVGKGTWNRLFVEGLEIVNFQRSYPTD